MRKILMFAGTTEGRKLTEECIQYGIPIHVCVATEYGETLLPKGEEISITSKRLDSFQMEELIKAEQVSLVIDATHPYAVQVSANIKQACKRTEKEYIRLLREPIQEEESHCIYVDSIELAVEYLKETKGNVFLTTGSKELSKYTAIENYSARLYARVLSTPKVVAECADMGFEGKNLICMQGPFSEELNYAMLKQINASYMVTKESGNVGGYIEKLNAAHAAGVKVIVIGRPYQEEGISYEECLDIIKNRYQLPRKRYITLLGIGMGSYHNMTMEGIEACNQADVLIGAKRMVDALKEFQKPTFLSFLPEEICHYLDTHPEYQNIVIAFSGDTGFYSGATQFIHALKDYEVKVMPGISSVVYLCAKLQIPWQDVKCISLHGRNQNIIHAVKRNTKVFSLLGGKDGVYKLCQRLIDYGLEKVILYIGEQLSYKGEKITKGTPNQFIHMRFEEPCVVLIENKAVKDSVLTHGLADESFIRGNVPMTKEEVRSVAISKLRLTKDSIIYDIGAGTGSVSIEMALQAVHGTVYAIEMDSEGIVLIEKNKRKFGTENLIPIGGFAPKALEELEAPTHGFIGGSSGNLHHIIELLLRKNPNIRIVINAIALETIAEVMNCLNTLEVIDIEIIQVSVSKSKTLGSYHMMIGQNPVYIISCTGGRANAVT